MIDKQTFAPGELFRIMPDGSRKEVTTVRELQWSRDRLVDVAIDMLSVANVREFMVDRAPPRGLS